MSTNFKHRSRQSGALGIWLVLTTLAMALAFLVSWMQIKKPESGGPFDSVQSDSDNAPEKELKLLAAEVVSRTNVMTRNTAWSTDLRLDISQAAADVIVSHGPSAKLVQEQEPVTEPVDELVAPTVVAGALPAQLPDVTVEPDPDDVVIVEDFENPAEMDQLFAHLQQARTEVEPAVEIASVETTVGMSESEKDPDISPQLDALRTLIGEVLAIDANNLEESSLASLRSEKLDSLAVLSTEVRFSEGSKEILNQTSLALTEIFDILTQYDDTQITVSVSTHESGDARKDLRLSQERGRAIIARGVSQGIDLSRITLEAAHGEVDPGNLHTIAIKAEPASNTTTQ